MDITNEVRTEFTVDDKTSKPLFDMADAYKKATSTLAMFTEGMNSTAVVQKAYAQNIDNMARHLAQVSTVSKTAQNSLREYFNVAVNNSALASVEGMTTALGKFSSSVASRKSAFTDVSHALSQITMEGDKAQLAMSKLQSTVGGLQQAITARLSSGTSLTPNIDATYTNLKAQVASMEGQLATGGGGKELRQQIIEAKTQLALLSEEYTAYAHTATTADEEVSASFLKQTKDVNVLTEYLQKLNALYLEQGRIAKSASGQAETTNAYREQLSIQKEMESVMSRMRSLDRASGTSLLAKATGQSVRGLQYLIMDIGRLGIVSPKVSYFASILTVLNTTLGNTANIATLFGKIAGVVAALTLVKLTQEAVKASAAFQEYENTLKALSQFDWAGKMSSGTAISGVGSAVFKEGVEYSAKTGYNIEQVNKALEKLVGYGIDMRSVNSVMEMLGNLALGDSKRLTNLSVAFGQTFGQGKARAQEMYQFVNAGIPIFDLMAKKLGKSTDVIMDMTRKGKMSFTEIYGLLQDLTSEGGRYADIMEKITGNTFNKQTEVFSTELKQLLANIGDKLLPSVTSLLKQVNASLGEYNKGVSVKEYAASIQNAIQLGPKAVEQATAPVSTTILQEYVAPLDKLLAFLTTLQNVGELQGTKYAAVSEGVTKANAQETQEDRLAVFNDVFSANKKTVLDVLNNMFKKLEEPYPTFISTFGKQLSDVIRNMPASSVLDFTKKAGFEQSNTMMQLIYSLQHGGTKTENAKAKAASTQIKAGELGMPTSVPQLTQMGLRSSNSDIYRALKEMLSPMYITNELNKQLSNASSAKVQPAATTRATLDALKQRQNTPIGNAPDTEETGLGGGKATSELAKYNQKLSDTGVQYVAITPLMQELVKIQELYSQDLATIGGLQDKYVGKEYKSVDALQEMGKQLNATYDWKKLTTFADAQAKVTEELGKARTKAVSLYQAEEQLSVTQKTFSTFQGAWDPFKNVFNVSEDSVSKMRKELINKGVKSLQESTQMTDPQSEAKFRAIVTEQVDFTENLQKAKISASDMRNSFSDLYAYTRDANFGLATIADSLDNVKLIADAMGESADSASRLLEYMAQIGGLKVPVSSYVEALNEYKKVMVSPTTQLTTAESNKYNSALGVYRMSQDAANSLPSQYTGNTRKARDLLLKQITGTTISARNGSDDSMYNKINEGITDKLTQEPLANYNNAMYALQNPSKVSTDQYKGAITNVRKYKQELDSAAKATNLLTEGENKIKEAAISLGEDGFKAAFKTLGESIMSGESWIDSFADSFKNLAASFLDNVSSVLISVAVGFAQAGEPWMALAALGAAGLTSLVSGIVGYSDTKSSDSNDAYTQALSNLQNQLETFMEQFRDTLAYVDEARRAYIASQQLALAGKYANGDSFAGGTSLKEGVYTQPTIFQYAKGDAFGEVAEVPGKAEAVMPLERGANGKLGVTNYGGVGNVSIDIPVQIINNTTSEVTAEREENADGSMQLQIYINKAMSQGIAKGGVDTAMAARYASRFRGVRRS